MWDRAPRPARPGAGSLPVVLWAKVLVPVVLATAGVGAGVAAAVLPDGAAAVGGPAQAWIDSPVPDATFGPGTIPVDAHAADPVSKIAALELLVDGDAVATDDDLDRTEDLVLATFDWDAAVGVHELVVREVGGGAVSAPITVTIGEGMEPAPDRAEDGAEEEVAAGSSSTTEVDPASSTAPDDSTTTSTAPEETTTSEPGPEVTGPSGPTGPTPTTTPPSGPTTAPPGTQPATPPTIQRATLFPSPAVLFTSGCGYTVEVAVSAVNAEAVTVSVDGTSFFRQMTPSSGAFTLTLTGGSQWNGAPGNHTVTVVAGNGDSTATATAGTVTIDDRPGCPKD